MSFKITTSIDIENIPVKVDEEKINLLYNGDYKKALEDTLKSERNQTIRNSCLKEENMKLKDKVEQLQDRIDKAIEYIENEAIIENLKADHTYITINQDGLLNILKGR